MSHRKKQNLNQLPVTDQLPQEINVLQEIE